MFRRLVASAVLAPLLLAAACASASAQTKIRFSLDWRVEGPAAPFLIALDHGYFADEGLDVTLEPSAGSVEPVTRVATGSFDMGFGDINTLIRYRATHPERAVRAVFMVYNTPPFAVIGRRSRGISDPKSLEGKTIGAPQADGAYAQWQLFLKANVIDASTLKIVNLGFPVREPMLAAGEVDAVTGFAHSVLLNLMDKGVPREDIIVLPMTGQEVDLYGNAIIVNPDFAEAHPDAVRGFLRAYLRGLKDVARDPDAAIGTVLTRNANAKWEVELERLTMVLKDNILTEEVRANGYGIVDMARLSRSIQLIAEANGIANPPGASNIFDSSFLPPPAERAVD